MSSLCIKFVFLLFCHRSSQDRNTLMTENCNGAQLSNYCLAVVSHIFKMYSLKGHCTLHYTQVL